MSFTKINDSDLANKGVVGLADTPNLSTGDMQRKFDEIATDVIVPKFNELSDELDNAELEKVPHSDDVTNFRLDEEGMLQISTNNGETYGYAGATGHQIIDGNGTKYPARPKLQFSPNVTIYDYDKENGNKTYLQVTGAKGDKGNSGTITIGEVNVGENPKVENVGSKSDAILDFTLPKGEKGDSAIIRVGNVTKGDVASVTNVGTEVEAIFDFVLPKGDKGDEGTGLKYLGKYATIEDLQNAHPTGNPGDAYVVGTSEGGSGNYTAGDGIDISDNDEISVNDTIARKTEIPTNTSQLTNDSNFVIDSNYNHTDNNYTNTDKNKVANIPTSTSQLTNDSNFVEDANYEHVDEALVESWGFSKGGGDGEHIDILQADYDALSDAEKNNPNKYYFITDGENGLADTSIVSDKWTARTYSVGEYCIDNNTLWKCLVQNSERPSEGANWHKTNVGNELKPTKPDYGHPVTILTTNNQTYTCNEDGYLSFYTNGINGSASLRIDDSTIVYTTSASTISPIPVFKGSVVQLVINSGAGHSVSFFPAIK